MPKFGKTSLARLETVDADLRQLCFDVVELYDITVLCGHRTKAEQIAAVESGASTVFWPHSRHNLNPSLAVDIAPYPIDWEDKARFCYMAGLMMQAARYHGFRLRWGGNWDMDGQILSDQEFDDLPHFELI